MDLQSSITVCSSPIEKQINTNSEDKVGVCGEKWWSPNCHCFLRSSDVEHDDAVYVGGGIGNRRGEGLIWRGMKWSLEVEEEERDDRGDGKLTLFG